MTIGINNIFEKNSALFQWHLQKAYSAACVTLHDTVKSNLNCRPYSACCFFIVQLYLYAFSYNKI